MGFYYSTFIQDGVMFVGEACGGSGVVHGMISAHYAARVAIESVRENKKDTGRVMEYERIMKESDIVMNPFCYRHVRSHYGSYQSWLERSGNIKV